jgi:hypothetical protein
MPIRSHSVILSMIVACLGAHMFAQARPDDGAAGLVAGTLPVYVQVAPRAVQPDAAVAVQPVESGTVLDFGSGVTSQDVLTAGSDPAGQSDASGGSRSADPEELLGGRRTPPGGNIIGLETVPTFSGAFIGLAGPSLGKFFPYTMMGNHPSAGEETIIPTKITEVSLSLLNADGTLNIDVPFAPFERRVLNSPNFEEASYTSGHRLQFADAVQRAEFFNVMGEEWHTTLRPRVVNKVTFTIPRFVNVRFPDGSVKPVQAYRLGTGADGRPFVLMLDLLFNALNTNQVVTDIVAKNFTTNALNTNLYPNTFLFSIDTQGQPAGCCVLGFHTYFFQTGVFPQPRWIFQYASWISPGIFGGGFQDVTALSHEISEAFNDPFVNNATPSWQFPGVPATAKICQGNLETGDPVEGLPNPTFPVVIRENGRSFRYHPQTEALLQWFTMGPTSNAIDGAFSYPDTTALPQSALPCPQ